MVDALCSFAVGAGDLDPYGREIDDPLLELYQDLVHRLFERPGSNIDDSDRGVGIEELLSSSFDPKAGAIGEQISKRIVSDFTKDDRVSDAAANVVDRGGGKFVVDIQVVCNDGILGITLESDGGGGVRVARQT